MQSDGLNKNSYTCPKNVRRMRGSIRLKWDDLAFFGRVQLILFNDLRGSRHVPKAEVARLV